MEDELGCFVLDYLDWCEKNPPFLPRTRDDAIRALKNNAQFLTIEQFSACVNFIAGDRNYEAFTDSLWNSTVDIPTGD